MFTARSRLIRVVLVSCGCATALVGCGSATHSSSAGRAPVTTSLQAVPFKAVVSPAQPDLVKSTAGPNELCDLLTIDDADDFTGAAMNQVGHGPKSCDYTGVDAAQHALQLSLQWILGATVADLPLNLAAIEHLGDAARGNDREVHVIVDGMMVVLTSSPAGRPGALTALARNVIDAWTGF